MDIPGQSIKKAATEMGSEAACVSKDEALDKALCEMRNVFLVPPLPAEAFAQLDELIDRRDVKYQAIAQAFKHNLASALSAVATPFHLASGSVHASHFQRLHIAERIRALSITAEEIDPGEELEEVRERKAYQKARALMAEFSTSGDGQRAIILDICRFLTNNLRESEMEVAAKELVRQGVILIWSAFEVLFRDTFELELNIDPSKAALLAQDVSTRKKLEVQRFSLGSLMKYGFDLSDKIGTLLVCEHDFSKLTTIKSVYSILLPNCSGLAACLNHPDLWLLYQRRHLFVHRRGVVDATYLENTSDMVPLGSTLELSPKDLEGHFNRVLEAGEALLRCLPPSSPQLTGVSG